MDVSKNQSAGISKVPFDKTDFYQNKKGNTAAPAPQIENGEEKMKNTLDCLAGQVPVVKPSLEKDLKESLDTSKHEKLESVNDDTNTVSVNNTPNQSSMDQTPSPIKVPENSKELDYYPMCDGPTVTEPTEKVMTEVLEVPEVPEDPEDPEVPEVPPIGETDPNREWKKAMIKYRVANLELRDRLIQTLDNMGFRINGLGGYDLLTKMIDAANTPEKVSLANQLLDEGIQETDENWMYTYIDKLDELDIKKEDQ